MKIRYCHLATIVAALVIMLPHSALAQICDISDGLLPNGDFEVPDVDSTPPTPLTVFGVRPTAAVIYAAADIPNWQTTAADNTIEIWQSGHLGVPSLSGVQHAEVNGNDVGAIFQDIPVTPGSTINWGFGHQGRFGIDTIELLIGPAAGTLVSQGTFSTDNTGWDFKQGFYAVPAGVTIIRLQLEAVSTANNNLTTGNFVDAVRVLPICDFGDAPASYPVDPNAGGAAHILRAGERLGADIDNEFASNASPDASGDDALFRDDEDGVSFGPGGNGNLARNNANAIEITASAPGYVNVWIDLDANGNWEASDRVLSDAPVTAGTQILSANIPDSATEGITFARVRYTSSNPSGALGPGGEWPDGEVEDYQVTIIGPAGLDVTKTSQAFQSTGPERFMLPGNDLLYTITVQNTGSTPTDTDSIVIIDAFPPDLEFFNGDANGPGVAGTDRIIFASAVAGLSFDPNSSNDVRFSTSTTPPADFADCPATAIASGYVADITYICLNPKGNLPTGNPAPSFTLTFRARIK